jgi:hypothetical protein
MATNPHVVMFVKFAGDGDTSTWHAVAYSEFNALKTHKVIVRKAAE